MWRHATPMTTNIKLKKDDEIEKVDERLHKGLIDNLQYLTTSKSNLLFVLSVHSRFMHSLRESHFIAAKRVL